MARQTPEERAAAAAQRAEEERADRERAERELAAINAFEKEHGRPPTKDELAERRAARAPAQADRELEVEMGGEPGGEQPASGGNGGSGSISERAQDPPDVREEDDGQMFVWEQGRRVSLGTLVARNVPVEHAFVFSGKRVKGRGGLMALDEKAVLVVRTLSGGTKVVPTHNDDETVKSVTVENIVNVKVINPADAPESIDLLRPVLRAAGFDIVPLTEQRRAS